MMINEVLPMREGMILEHDYERKAEILKAIAHPVRLCIIHGLLQEEECNVSKMQNCLEVPQSTVSQHLAKLKAAGIVEGKREGVEIYYRIVDKEVKKIIQGLFEE